MKTIKTFPFFISVFSLLLIGAVVIQTFITVNDTDPSQPLKAVSIFSIIVLVALVVLIVLSYLYSRVFYYKRQGGFSKKPSLILNIATAALVLSIGFSVGSIIENILDGNNDLYTSLILNIGLIAYFLMTMFPYKIRRSAAYCTTLSVFSLFPVVHCGYILVSAFVRFMSFSESAQYSLQQMQVIVSMIFFLKSSGIYWGVTSEKHRRSTFFFGMISVVFLSVSFIPKTLTTFILPGMSFNLPATFDPIFNGVLILYILAFCICDYKADTIEDHAFKATVPEI